MKNTTLISLLILASCAKQQVHPPVGGGLSASDMQTSRNRAKSLNEMERQQISEWIEKQPQKYYPMGLNYWTDVDGLSSRTRKSDGTSVSYSYQILDFDQNTFYDKPVDRHQAVLGKFEELKAVDDAVRYLNPGEKATLLVPSVLAFGTYGDNKEIQNDMPLIIRLKILDN